MHRVSPGRSSRRTISDFRILYSVLGDHHQMRNNPPQYYRDFAAFLGSLASHGADGIEVWNEPNIEREWPNGLISGGNYTEMLREAYAAIKAANANTLVISGAPSPTGYFQGGCQAGGCNDDVFLRQMAAAGAANYMDCLGIHYNSGAVPPTARSGAPRRQLRSLHLVLPDNGGAVPLALPWQAALLHGNRLRFARRLWVDFERLCLGREYDRRAASGMAGNRCTPGTWQRHRSPLHRLEYRRHALQQ